MYNNLQETGIDIESRMSIGSDSAMGKRGTREWDREQLKLAVAASGQDESAARAPKGECRGADQRSSATSPALDNGSTQRRRRNLQLVFQVQDPRTPNGLIRIRTGLVCVCAGHTSDCNPDPTSALRFSPDAACDSVPIRFYSRPVRNSLPHPAFNPGFATSHNSNLDEVGSCVRPLSLFYSDASADAVKERSLVPHSRSHARLRRNATMSYAFSCTQPAFIGL
ncbi:hypothetical protein EVAR_20951_1 [Eumeta japonica]|uniref:Uncharacterized protein n=1 Tax=Eumeta variegata TaxID=151549 RepID=A0A4C1V5P9_EUMVA|nr:hypothetical protein EVAR_20951_1 [Eumeta japonica]